MKIFCFDPKKNSNVYAGEYNDFDHSFIKKVNDCHFMVVEKAWGIQEDVLQQLHKIGCINVVIRTSKGLQISLLSDWFKRPIKNYGHGPQRFLGRQTLVDGRLE